MRHNSFSWHGDGYRIHLNYLTSKRLCSTKLRLENNSAGENMSKTNSEGNKTRNGIIANVDNFEEIKHILLP